MRNVAMGSERGQIISAAYFPVVLTAPLRVIIHPVYQGVNAGVENSSEVQNVLNQSRNLWKTG